MFLRKPRVVDMGELNCVHAVNKQTASCNSTSFCVFPYHTMLTLHDPENTTVLILHKNFYTMYRHPIVEASVT
jgi:hypothetical protein